jgi:adenylosuccinate synthase
MAVTAIIGAQWGDEGKGRVVDYLAQRADLVIRFQGGDNAGHTVVNQYGKHALHIIPSGIFNPNTMNIIGSGCVVNPQGLLQEMSSLKATGVVLENLWLSSRAHMVLPYHQQLDGLEEEERSNNKIGTTKRGIGPAYTDKAARSGMRMGDLLYPDWLESRLYNAVDLVNRKLAAFGETELDGSLVDALCLEYREELADRIVDVIPIVREAMQANKNLLLEGQLGVMRDLDWGIYPYVTSSNPTAAFAPVGVGIPTNSISQIIGVVKAYSTAVGAGPFPTELFDSDGDKLRDIGEEYGATTGRPRRCGWFDGVAIKYAAWLNGMTALAITKLDILDHFEKLNICTGYRLPNGEISVESMPFTPELNLVEPIYEEWEGWNCDTSQCRSWGDLPGGARAYLSRISQLANVPIGYVSVGPERDAIIEKVNR